MKRKQEMEQKKDIRQLMESFSLINLYLLAISATDPLIRDVARECISMEKNKYLPCPFCGKDRNCAICMHDKKR
jgi:hypothetical protein